jgi:hypothetical protein
MSTSPSENREQTYQRRIGDASAYSARVQEAMRYDKLTSSDYILVMALLDAVLQGQTQQQWEARQQRMLKALIEQPPDQRVTHAGAANRYEQVIGRLKDLALWPW